MAMAGVSTSGRPSSASGASTVATRRRAAAAAAAAAGASSAAAAAHSALPRASRRRGPQSPASSVDAARGSAVGATGRTAKGGSSGAASSCRGSFNLFSLGGRAPRPTGCSSGSLACFSAAREETAVAFGASGEASTSRPGARRRPAARRSAACEKAAVAFAGEASTSRPGAQRRPAARTLACASQAGGGVGPSGGADGEHGKVLMLPLQPPPIQIIYQDEHLVAIEKPSNYFVHAPEDGFPIPQEENMMKVLRTQLGGTWLYPVHRLDRPTSGVLVYGLSKEAASGFGRATLERRVEKTYVCMSRGHPKEAYGIIDKPLGGATAVTLFETLATAELPVPVGRYPAARYSLLKVTPVTGTYHQIRRHLNRIDRPIVGDTDHGDRAHNRLWAGEQLRCPGLFLKCARMAFDHPVTGEPLELLSPVWEERWQAAFKAFGLCALPYFEGSGQEAAMALGLSYEELRTQVVEAAPAHFDGRAD